MKILASSALYLVIIMNLKQRENTKHSERARKVKLCGNFTTNGGLKTEAPDRKMHFLKSKALLITAMSGL